MKHVKRNILISSLFLLVILIIPFVSANLNPSDLQKQNIPYINLNSLIPSVKIGDTTITTQPVQFVCKSEIATLYTEQRQLFSGGKDIIQNVQIPTYIGTIQISNPRHDCWHTSLYWDSTLIPFKSGEKRAINQYVAITFDGDASFVTFNIEKISYEQRDKTGKIIGSPIREWITYYGVFKNPADERRLYTFEVNNQFLRMGWKQESNLLRINSNDNPTLIIQNDFINNMDGEILIKIIKSVTKEERQIAIPLKLLKGYQEYPLNLPKETLGGLITEVKINVDFLGVKIYSNDQLQRTFNVVPKLFPEMNYEEFNAEIEKNQEQKQQLILQAQELAQAEEAKSSNIFIIIIMVVAIGFTVKYLLKNGKKK